jgi:hypothetical protein
MENNMENFVPKKFENRKPDYNYYDNLVRTAPTKLWQFVDRWMETLQRIEDADHDDANELENQHKVLLKEAIRTAEAAKTDENLSEDAKKAAEDLVQFEKNELGMHSEKE